MGRPKRQFMCICIRDMDLLFHGKRHIIAHRGVNYICNFYDTLWSVFLDEWKANITDEMFNTYFRVESEYNAKSKELAERRHHGKEYIQK